MDVANLFSVKGKVALVVRPPNPPVLPHLLLNTLQTGGAKGIGRMISEGFVRAGAKVYISSRDAKSCEQAVQELNATGPGTAAAIPANFYDEKECKRLADELKRRESSASAYNHPKSVPKSRAEFQGLTEVSVQSYIYWLTIREVTGARLSMNIRTTPGSES